MLFRSDYGRRKKAAFRNLVNKGNNIGSGYFYGLVQISALLSLRSVPVLRDRDEVMKQTIETRTGDWQTRCFKLGSQKVILKFLHDF